MKSVLLRITRRKPWPVITSVRNFRQPRAQELVLEAAYLGLMLHCSRRDTVPRCVREVTSMDASTHYAWPYCGHVGFDSVAVSVVSVSWSRHSVQEVASAYQAPAS